MARDTYEKQTWENLPSETTPVNAERLTHIEDGIKTAMDNRALKEIYDDYSISVGRKAGTAIRSYSSAVGIDVAATGDASHAEGYATIASNHYAHAEGKETVASGICSHAEGEKTKASLKSHAEGVETEADNYSHAEGRKTTANNYSHAEGYQTTATGYYSHAEGSGTKASGASSHVHGKFNIEDTSSKYAEIVGGGYSDTSRMNIYTLDWQGNAKYAGDVENGNGVSINNLKSEVDNLKDIAKGGVAAKTFDTKNALETWLAVEGNPETLSVGQNIYIRETDTPDYWWDGTELQILETEKVSLEGYVTETQLDTKLSEYAKNTDVPSLTNNLLATVPGQSALDAVQGKVLSDQINQLNSDLLKMPQNIIRKVNAREFTFEMDAGNYLVVVLSNASGRIGFTAYICGSQYESDIASTYSGIVKIFDNSITESNVSATKDGNAITIINEAKNGSFITVTKL